jgi:hypothetical protein
MLTANQIVSLACEAAHSPGKTAQAQQFLNAILADLCRTYDFADARGQFKFNFNPGLTSNFGSGPYPLPLDYLRVGAAGSTGAQRAYIWYLNGVPYPMVPVDLAEWDMQVQQAGLNSYPWLWATDMGDLPDDRIICSTAAAITDGSTAIAVPTAATGFARILAGMGVAGQGIVPGTTLVSITAGGAGVLSVAATLTLSNASVFFGSVPNGYAYPPPSAALPVSIRFQRLMPDIVDFSRVPWFPKTDYLIEKLTGRLCQLNDDDRATLLLGGPNVVGSPDNKLSLFLAMKDAQTDRVNTVQLDRRRFGSSFSKLPNTKQIGW